MIEIAFIRHGETDYNRDWKYLGNTDVTLNETGISQAKLISPKLQNEEFDVIHCSDLRRCRQTAELIGFDQDIVYNDQFREVNFGVVEGLTYKEIEVRHPEVAENWKNNWFDYVVPGGESFAQVQKRVVDQVEELKKSGHKKMAVVTHGGCIRLILAHYIVNEPRAFYKFNIENATINRLCFTDNYPYIKSINERS